MNNISENVWLRYQIFNIKSWEGYTKALRLLNKHALNTETFKMIAY